MTPVAITATICVAALISLVLVLRHLVAMRATTGEIAALTENYAGLSHEFRSQMAQSNKHVADIEQRLTHVDNRTKR